MDESQIELYLATLTFAAIDHREWSAEERRYLERMRGRYAAQCQALDDQVSSELRESPRYQKSLARK